MLLAESVIAARLFRDLNAGRPHVSAPLDQLLGALLEQLRAHRGLVMLTGPAGSGKSVALRQLAIDAEPGIAARVVRATGQATPDELCEAVLQSLKAAPALGDEPRQLRLRRHLAGATTPYPALLIEDAEALSPPVLAMLAEFATPREGAPAVTVVLASRLAPSALLKFPSGAAAVTAAFTMPRLSATHVDHFIRARLRAAQLPLDTFPAQVLALLSQRSEGLPGELMRLAGDALERAIGAGRMVVTEADVAGSAPAPLAESRATPAAPPAPVATPPSPGEPEIEAALRRFSTSHASGAAATRAAQPDPALPALTIAPCPNPTPPDAAATPAAAQPSPPPAHRKPISWQRETFKVAAMAAGTVAVAATLVAFLPRLLVPASEPVAMEATIPNRPAVAAVVSDAPAPPVEVTPAEPEGTRLAALDPGNSTPARVDESAPAMPPAPPADEAPSVGRDAVASAPAAEDVAARESGTSGDEDSVAAIEQSSGSTAPAFPVEPKESLAVAMAVGMPAPPAAPAADPFDAAALAELFREAQVAIDSAEHGGFGHATPVAMTSGRTIDPALRHDFEQFMNSIEAAPGSPAYDASFRQFELFLTRTGALSRTAGSAESAAH